MKNQLHFFSWLLQAQFQKEFDQATIVTEDFITKYEEVYNQKSQKVKEIEEVEQKEKAVNKLKDKLLEFKGQINIIVTKYESIHTFFSFVPA